MARQRDLEASALSLGRDAFYRRVDGAVESGAQSTAGAGRKLLQEAVPRMSAAIADMISQSEGSRGPKLHAVRWVRMLDRYTKAGKLAESGADVVAYITAKALLDKLAGHHRLREAANTIAGLMIDELRFRRFRDEAPGLFGYALDQFHTSNYRHKANSLAHRMTTAKVQVDDETEVVGIKVDDLEMAADVKLHVGYKLIGLFVESTGLVDLVNNSVGVKTGRRRLVKHEQYLKPTQETLDWVSARNLKLEDLSPVVTPMVVPPLEWARGVRGGYRFALRGKYPMVRGIGRSHAATINKTELPVVYTALNAVQSTAWQINRSVLDVALAIKASTLPMAGVPAFDKLAEPTKPADINTNDEARRLYRKSRHAMLEAEAFRIVRATEVNYTLAAAQSVAGDESIYFPYNVDFRGRLYPIAGYLSPQGSDLAKAMLTFSKRKALGKDGAAWLAIHGANKLDKTADGLRLGKSSLADRVRWIEAHTNDICAAAADPFGVTWWTAADKPLQFLAFCFEWARLREWMAIGSAQDFLSNLPCAVDGTCNGLQHFSAAWRDPKGGATVNLIPSPLPEDVYHRISDAVLDKLEQIAASDPIAALWLTSGLVDRDLCKRPTMTFGYGSKPYGFAQQIKKYLREPKRWATVKAQFVDAEGKTVLNEASELMASLIWDALGVIVVAAFSGMAWMQQAASAVNAGGKPMSWSVPLTGFPVLQEYYKCKLTRVKTILLGSVMRPSVYTKTNELLQSKQRNAIAPNVVHSLDAAALMLTVQEAASLGVESFGMIHDSYATVAGDMNTLTTATREMFVRLYTEGEVVNSLAEQWRAMSAKPEKFPEAPTAGALDVTGVLNSLYFFA